MSTPDLPEALTVFSHYFVEFCAANFASYHLLFQPTISRFVLSPESLRISPDNLVKLGELLDQCSVKDPEMLDLFTAPGTGLSDQVPSTIWMPIAVIRLIDGALEM